MTDKKIIDNKEVKENNPNDDEEILRNDQDTIPDTENKEEPNKSNEKNQDNELIRIP